MVVAGIMVGRLPHLNVLPPMQTAVRQINGYYDTGLDRLPWVDVFDEDFYTGRVADEVRKLALGIRETNRDVSGITLCRDADIASVLLEHSNRRGLANEVIAVRSLHLAAIKGTVDIDRPVEWLGYDVMSLGDWSLIADGPFIDPQYYAAWLSKINRYGFFSDCTPIEDYIAAYEEGVAKEKSEPLTPLGSGFPRIAIEVGRIR